MGCQLADELASGFGLHASASEQCIDVLSEGFAFRIFLASERCVVCLTFPVQLGQAVPGLITSMSLNHWFSCEASCLMEILQQILSLLNKLLL